MLSADFDVLTAGARTRREENSELEPNDQLVLPAVADPAAYCRSTLDTYKGDLTGEVDREHRMLFAKGTTTLAFKFQGGVVVSVDSRSTQGPYIGACCATKLCTHVWLWL